MFFEKKKMKTKKELMEEMFEDWLWKENYDELYNHAMKEVEKEVGFWRSIKGLKKEIADRHNELFEKLLSKVNGNYKQS